MVGVASEAQAISRAEEQHLGRLSVTVAPPPRRLPPLAWMECVMHDCSRIYMHVDQRLYTRDREGAAHTSHMLLT